MSIRLVDIAMETGFSVNTVSLALNNSPRISHETCQIIHSTATRLHYVPNKAARSLVTRQSKLIGLIVREFNNVILNMVAVRLERELYRIGYVLLLVTTAYPKGELEALRVLEAQQVDGIFMYPCLPPDRLVVEYIKRLNMPVIMLSFGNYDLFTDAIYVNKEYAAYLATSHLLSLGHKKIALICGSANNQNMQIDSDRLSGYCRALSEAGMPYNPAYAVMPESGHYQAGYDTAREIYRRSDVTAIIGAYDPVACGAMMYYLDHGVRVPEDVSFISNDSTEVAAFAPVPLTATVYSVDELTSKAIELMIRRLEEPNKEAPIRTTIQATLDVRKSTMPPPV